MPSSFSLRFFLTSSFSAAAYLWFLNSLSLFPAKLQERYYSIESAVKDSDIANKNGLKALKDEVKDRIIPEPHSQWASSRINLNLFEFTLLVFRIFYVSFSHAQTDIIAISMYLPCFLVDSSFFLVHILLFAILSLEPLRFPVPSPFSHLFRTYSFASSSPSL